MEKSNVIYWLIVLTISFIWGAISGKFIPEPACYIFSFIGGAIIGLICAVIRTKLKQND